MPDPIIKHLMFYPIKSAAGIPLANAYLNEQGLTYGEYTDHQYMIVRKETNNGAHDFLTQRDKRHENDSPQSLSILSQLRPRLTNDVLELTYQGKDPIHLAHHNDGKHVHVRLWDEVFSAIDQGDRLAQWCSNYLDLDVRLVKTPSSFDRKTKQNYTAHQNPLRFQDGYPIHWFPMESLEELCQKAGQEIHWTSFRPQIVIEGMTPQEEHAIYSGKIAGIPFVNPKPCERCPITKVHQQTGEVRKKEPLATLAKYKRWKSSNGETKVIFGENMSPLGEGAITIGDSLKVIEYRNPPLEYGK